MARVDYRERKLLENAVKRLSLTVLALTLAFSGCAQNKGKVAKEAAQPSRVDTLEASFSRFQEQQRARDADIDYKLREIATRLDKLGSGQAPAPKATKGKERKPVAASASRQPIVAGQVIPYSQLSGTAPAQTPMPAQVQQSPSAPQPVSAQPAAVQPAPQPLPALQPPVVTLGESAGRLQPATLMQARQPMPVSAPRSAKEKTSARTPQPVSGLTQPAPVSPAPAPAPHQAKAPATAAASPQTTDMQEQLLYTEALRSVSANKNDEGRKKFNDFLAKYPSSSKTPEALYWIGESYMGDKSYNQAILAFKEVTTRFPKDSKSAESLYRIADAYERLGDKSNAVFHLKMLVDENPNSEFAGKAKQKLKQLGQ